MFLSRLVALACCAFSTLAATELRVLPPGQLPRDVRLGPLKELDGYFPFTPSATREQWAIRRERVQRQIAVTLGLWPRPELPPLQPQINGRMDMGDYTVEKAFFESLPGLFVTGNLYRPKDSAVKHAGILCPYGHWPNGRFLHYPDTEVAKAMQSGAERITEAAQSPLQARCVQLARMGCVVFHYDMLDRGDSVQFAPNLPHGFAKQRPEMNAATRWGLFSPQAESRYQSVMGLQTLNSLRALDFLAGLPDVDPARLAVTGASGGGTQTMILAALEPDRLAAAFPAVMVSTAMQGGCTCENASGLRIGTGNVEFAALFAPKPMGMTAANDWTKEMPVRGLPELKAHWALLGAPERVSLAAHLEFPHNYNSVSRAALYDFLNRYLDLKLPAERLAEKPFTLLSTEQMTVWDAAHPAPAGGPEFEIALLQAWSTAAHAQPDLKAIEIVASRAWSEAGEVVSDLREKTDRGDYWELTGTIRNQTWGEEIPALYYYPKKWGGRTVLRLAEDGKAALVTAEGQPRPEIRALLAAGVSVIGVDLIGQGEFLAEGEKPDTTRHSKNPREAAAYTFGYNDALFAQRVHDILSVRRLVETNEHHHTRAFGLLATGRTGPVAALARALAPDRFDAAALDDTGFRFGDVTDLHDPMFLPGGAKYGDLPGILSLGGVRPLLPTGDPAAAAEWLVQKLP